MEDLDILYDDSLMIAVNKPPGMLVHKSELDRHETVFLLQLLRNQLGSHVYPIHRLDKPTSGVLLFSYTSEFAKELNDCFEQRNIEKKYLALVRGWFPENLTVDRGIRRDKDNERREALTEFSNLTHTEIDVPVGPFDTARYSLIMAKPKTGRRHQIRKHLNHASYPIVGDFWYGDRDHNALFEKRLGARKLFLHASSVSFVHPTTQKLTLIEAPLPVFWTDILDWLSLKWPLDNS